MRGKIYCAIVRARFLLAYSTQILGLIYKTILKDRNGTGLVLWIVPSDQIYKDTLRRLRDRSDFYRESLEFAVSHRMIEVWEKDEIFRITPSQMRNNLNILLLKLASTNRESREQLKFFSIQGYRRPGIYPDFVIQEGEGKKPVASVLVVESKGKHLQGNPDTEYKRSIAKYFSEVGHEVPWQKLAEEFRDSTFRVQVIDEGEYADQTWRDELRELLEQPS